MVGIQQARSASHDAVTVMIGVARPSNIEFLPQAKEALHRIARGTIHTDLAIMVNGHERESRVYGPVYNRNIQFVEFRDHVPVAN